MELLGLTRFRSRNCITNTSPILYICHKKKITHTNISVCIIREVRQHSLLSELRVPSHISSSATLSCNIGIRVLGAVVTYNSSPPASIYYRKLHDTLNRDQTEGKEGRKHGGRQEATTECLSNRWVACGEGCGKLGNSQMWL